MGLYLRHQSSFRHDTGGHPESARRLIAIEEALAGRDWLGMERLEAPPVDRRCLLRVHEEAHVDAIEQISARGGGMLDLDTVASEGSWEAALHSAGGAVAAVERLLELGSGFAFCGLRPPGHHAERDRAMGFCLFNNIAVAGAHALDSRGLERVLVLDWDVHHGNGTESIFYESGRLLYVSLHQSPLYPGTGAMGDAGRGEGEGFTLNLPVPPGTGGDEYLSLVQNVVVPVARAYEPGLLLVSAGYDAHRDDPLAACVLDERDYFELAATIRELAEELGVPVAVCLEGGYALRALAGSVVATLAGLGGEAPARVAPKQPAAAYRDHHARHWPVLDG